MTQIYETDAAIVRELQRCGFPSVDVKSGPHQWDDGYLRGLLTSTPAIRVCFLGADEIKDTGPSTELTLAGRWAAYIVVSWNGKTESSRRLGQGGGLDLLHRCASALHGLVLKEEDGSRLPIVSVTGLDVLTDSAVDIANLWVAAVDLAVELPLDLMPECTGVLDDFLRIRGPLVMPDPAPDIPLAVDLGP